MGCPNNEMKRQSEEKRDGRETRQCGTGRMVRSGTSDVSTE